MSPEPCVFPVLLEPCDSSSLSPVWKSYWGSLTIAAAEASRGKDWEYCWQHSWEYRISSRGRLEIHYVELSEERGRNKA